MRNERDAGNKLHDVAAREDEPRDSQHRGQIAHGDSFHADRHPDLKADFILANPPFNVSDWGASASPSFSVFQ